MRAGRHSPITFCLFVDVVFIVYGNCVYYIRYSGTVIGYCPGVQLKGATLGGKVARPGLELPTGAGRT